MIHRRLIRLAFVFALSGATGCPSNDASLPTDSGVDAAAATDSGTDASVDAGSDETDSAIDAGPLVCAPPTCDDSDVCTSDTCNGVTGLCEHGTATRVVTSTTTYNSLVASGTKAMPCADTFSRTDGAGAATITAICTTDATGSLRATVVVTIATVPSSTNGAPVTSGCSTATSSAGAVVTCCLP